MKKMSLLHSAKKHQRKRLLTGPDDIKLKPLEICTKKIIHRRTAVDQVEENKKPSSALLPPNTGLSVS
jgi:hypothetical protein